MKKIINGVRYDTEKATLIGSDSAPGMSMSDFHYWTESLYVSPQGKRYFVAGEGGALSQYGQPHGNNGRTGGEGVKILSREQAMQWAEAHLDPDVVEEHFGDLIDDA